MTNTIRIFFSLMLSAILCLGCAALAFASQPLGGGSVEILAQRSTVTFVNHEEKFSFEPGSEWTDSDLFDGFKGVMPGDELTETVAVTNGYGTSVEIFLRAEAHDEAGVADGNPMSPSVAGKNASVAYMSDFLSQLSMTVKHGDKVIYQASPDQVDGLEKNVSLGYIAPGASTELKVTLKVPIELDDTYANRVGEVDWVFTVVEYDPYVPPTEDPDDPLPPIEPDEPLPDTGDDPKPEGPLGQTGDTAPLALLAGVAVLAAVLVLVAAVMRRFGRR